MNTMKKIVLLGILTTLNVSAYASVLPLAAATQVAVEVSEAQANTPKKIVIVAPPSDVRSMEIIAKDSNIRLKVEADLASNIPTGYFIVITYNQTVLIAGQVPTLADKIKAGSVAKKITDVKKVWNYLTVGPNEDKIEMAQDPYLAVMAGNRLLGQHVNPNNFVVTASKGVVYIIGSHVGTKEQIETAISQIKAIENCDHIVNLIDQ